MKMPLKETKKSKMKVKPGTINLPEIELSETTRNNNKKEENNNSNNNNNETNQSSKNVTKTTKSPFPTISISSDDSSDNDDDDKNDNTDNNDSSSDSESTNSEGEDSDVDRDEYSTDWTSTDEDEDDIRYDKYINEATTSKTRQRKRTTDKMANIPPSPKHLRVTSSGKKKRRIMRKRTCFEKYCCETIVFILITGLSLAYFTTQYFRAKKVLNPESGLNEKQRVRYWDWPDPSTHRAIGHNWNHAVTTMWLPLDDYDDEEVAFQLNLGNEHDISPEGPGHVKMPNFFFEYTIFGLSAHNPADDALKINSEEYNRLAHEELRIDLQKLDPKPDYILDCIIEGRAVDTKEADGFAIAYRNTLPEKIMKRAERAVLLQARIYGQMGMYKWHKHQFGEHPLDHAVIIQQIKPTGGAMYRIKTSGPVNRVRWRDTLKPYQVDGQGQHTPKVEKYPRRRPRRKKDKSKKDDGD